MVFDYTIADAQPKPRSFARGLGCIKRVEYPVQSGLFYACACVFEDYLNKFAGLFYGNSKASALRHGVKCV